MPTRLTTNAVEKGTFAVTVSFTDETGAAVVPNSGLKWSLTDRAGNVINSRSDVTITPAASVTIVLSGDDLSLASYPNPERVLTIEGTYNSSLGSNLPIKDECRFVIVNLVRVT